jgi:hypothetical protein
MTGAVVLCVRLAEPPGEGSGHLALVSRVEQDAAESAGRVVGFGAERFTLAFPQEHGRGVFPLARSLALELGDSAIGIALGDVQLDGGAGRAFGAGLVLAEALANAARPGEILVHPELGSSDVLASNGTANVRFAGVTIRAVSCTAMADPSSVDDSRPTHPLLEPVGALPLPSVPPRPKGDGFAEPSSSRSPEPPSARTRVSLRPASPSAPPFRASRSVRPDAGDGITRATPPPKPSVAPSAAPPAGAARRSVPPKKPQGRASRLPPPPEDPDPAPAAAASPSQHPSQVPERPSVVEALRSGDAEIMLAVAEQLRNQGSHDGLIRRVEAMARLAQGEVGHGLDSLREAATSARLRDSKNQSRAALALAVGMALAGRQSEALLQGLQALSRARARADVRGESACAAFLGQLARAAGHPEVAEAWTAHSQLVQQ